MLELATINFMSFSSKVVCSIKQIKIEGLVGMDNIKTIIPLKIARKKLQEDGGVAADTVSFFF